MSRRVEIAEVLIADYDDAIAFWRSLEGPYPARGRFPGGDRWGSPRRDGPLRSRRPEWLPVPPRGRAEPPPAGDREAARGAVPGGLARGGIRAVPSVRAHRQCRGPGILPAIGLGGPDGSGDDDDRSQRRSVTSGAASASTAFCPPKAKDSESA